MTASAAERLARRAYRALWFAAIPFVAIYLQLRARRQPAYRAHWAERFLGRYATPAPGPCIWIHAVSVGETRATAPLVAASRKRWPRHPIVVTHMTPTGRETAIALYGDDVGHAYLPYDIPFALARFLDHWRPLIGLVMETEIWPNLMATADARGLPMLLVNGRLSQKSLDSALRWPALMRPAARRFTRILAQTDGDATRFAALVGPDGEPRIARVGNLKFDIDVPAGQRALAEEFLQRLGPRGVVLCASTREGEESAILDAWRAQGGPMPLLAIVPRHPQRFDEVAASAAAKGLRIARRSDEGAVGHDVDVWLGDSMGELVAYYLVADVAYVGGSIAPLGGQNLIEAAAAGCPVLLGPHTFNFAAASDDAVRAGAAVRVADYPTMVAEALAIVGDAGRRARMADAGIAFAAAHRGATERTLDEVAAVLEKSSLA